MKAPNQASDDTQRAREVQAALQAERPDLAIATPEPMADKGLAHWHFRLPGTGCIARVPKQSQMDLPAQENLAYQSACFARAAPSGHTPQLHGVLSPSVHLPRGALLVEDIHGRPARLPADLDAIMDALAAIHALALPAEHLRQPLLDPADPLQALRHEVDAQAVHLDAAGLSRASRAGIDAARERVREGAPSVRAAPRRLIAFDAHPGNFLMRDDGVAVLVDLEKARYGMAALDVAHATLVTSTTWDLDSSAVLSIEQVVEAYRHWSRALGAQGAGDPREWVLCRAAMWLWSITWCAKWRVLSQQPRRASADGEDWSGTMSEQQLQAHVRGRVDQYLSPQSVAFVIGELEALDRQAWS